MPRVAMTSPKKEQSLATVADGSSNGAQGGEIRASASKRSRPKRTRSKAEKKDIVVSPFRFHCNYCGRDLSMSVRVRCAVCPDYDSCLDCFSVGAALLPHQPDHSYRLLCVEQSPVYQKGWSAVEEEKMLEGLELFGVGNWEQVAERIMTKNAYESEQHFLRVYLSTIHAPLPDPTIMHHEDRPRSVSKDMTPKAPDMHKYQMGDAAGWMPKREDFVYEWDNEAEDILGDMEITEDDSPEEREMKLRVLEIYDNKLRERHRRKVYVLEHGLIDFKGHVEKESSLPEDEREVRGKLKVFARFLTAAEMDKCVNGILEERRLRETLQRLREGRALGATSAEECRRLVPKSKHAPTPPSRKRGSNDMKMTDPNTPCLTDSELRSTFTGRDVDVSQQAGAELLTRTELKLCTALKITVHQYVIVKEVLVRESARAGYLRKKEAKQMVRLDQTKVFRIYDYLLSCGWIRTSAA